MKDSRRKRIERAKQRQEMRDKRTPSEQLKIAWKRRGESKKEFARLRKQIEDNMQRNKEKEFNKSEASLNILPKLELR